MESWITAITVLQALTMLTCACGIVCNSVVVWLLGFRVQRNPFSVYLLNLAAADFLLLLFLALGKYGEFFILDRHVHLIFEHGTCFAYITGLSLLTAISVQRCFSVLLPIWYKVCRPRHLSTVVCTLIWVLALLVIILLAYFAFDILNNPFSNHYQDHKNMIVFLRILFLGFTTPVMILSSVVIFVQNQRRPREWRQRSSRLFVIILVSVLVFLLFSLPFGIFLALPEVFERMYYKDLFKSLFRFTSSLGSSANPFLYFFMGRRRRRGLWEPLRAILSRALQEDSDLSSKETSSTNTDEMGSVSQPAMVSAQMPSALG